MDPEPEAGEAISVKDATACYARTMLEKVPVHRRADLAKVVLGVLTHPYEEIAVEMIHNFKGAQEEQTGPRRHKNRDSILEGFLEACQSEVMSLSGNSDFTMDVHGNEKSEDKQIAEEYVTDGYEKCEDQRMVEADNADGDFQDSEEYQDDGLNSIEDDADDEDYTEVSHGKSASPSVSPRNKEKLVQAARFAINTQCPAPMTAKMAVTLYERLLAEPFDRRTSQNGNVPGMLSAHQAFNVAYFFITAIRQLPHAILDVTKSAKTKPNVVPDEVEAVLAKLQQSEGLEAVYRFVKVHSRSYDTTKTRLGAKKSARVLLLDSFRFFELHRLWNQICQEAEDPANEEMHGWATTSPSCSRDPRSGARGELMKYLKLNPHRWTVLLSKWKLPFEVHRQFGIGGLILAAGRSTKPLVDVWPTRMDRIMEILWEVDQEYKHPIKTLFDLVGRGIVQPVIEDLDLPKLSHRVVKDMAIHQTLERMGVAGEDLHYSDETDDE